MHVMAAGIAGCTGQLAACSGQPGQPKAVVSRGEGGERGMVKQERHFARDGGTPL